MDHWDKVFYLKVITGVAFFRIDIYSFLWFVLAIFLMITLILGLYLAYQSNMNGMQLILPVSNCCIPNFLIAVSLPLLIAKLMDLLCNIKLIGTILTKFFSFFGMISLEFYCVQEWIARKILPEMLKHAGNMLVNLELLIIVSICGLALYFVNKGVVKLFDFIDVHIINKNRGKN